MAIFYFGQYAPDLPALNNTGTLDADNVTPARGPVAGAVAYRPLRALEAASEAFAARIQGYLATRDTDGNVNIFAGSASKIERLAPSSTTPADVSISGGYSTAADARWHSTFDGAARVVMMNGPTGDPIQTYVIGSSSAFSDLSANAPKARSGAFVKNALMVVDINDDTNGHRPNGVRWSKRGDATTFDDVGTAPAIAGESDERLLNGDFGQCMTIRAGAPGADGVIWQEQAIWRINYVGGDPFYSFDLIDGAKGTPAEGSIVPIPGAYAYLGEDGFYITDGVTVSPIGSDLVDKTFFDTVDQLSFHRISGIPDPINKIVIWSYPAAGNSGTPNRLLIWNWSTRNWSRSSGVGDHEILVRSMSVGFSIDNLDTVFTSPDDMTVSLDSRTLTGGRTVLGAIDTNHKVASFTGEVLAASITTGEEEPVPGQRASVTRARPLVDGSSATVTVTPMWRNLQNEDVTTGTAASQGTDGSCPLRTSARYQRLRVDIAAGGDWDKAIGVEVPEREVHPMGYR